MHNKTPAERAARVPTIHIISDSIGETAQVVARAAAAQFGVTSPHLEIFSKVKSFEEVRGYLLEHARHHEEVLGDDRMLVMYTLVNADIREPLQGFLAEHPHIVAVDVLTAAVAAVSEMSGMEPVGKPGMLRVVDHNYFKRIGALEFTIAHDDGQNPEGHSRRPTSCFWGSRAPPRRRFPSTWLSRGCASPMCRWTHHRAALSDLRCRSHALVRAHDHA